MSSTDPDVGWTNLEQLALQLCMHWHRGQTDRAGRPYAEHPIEVARRAYAHTMRPAAKCVGLMHDVLEDTDMPSSMLYAFPDDVAYAVIALTRWKEESANAYIKRVVENPLAAIVKVHDIEHNFSPGRVDTHIMLHASMYAGWHQKLCNALQLRRSFCSVYSPLQSVCACPGCNTGSRL